MWAFINIYIGTPNNIFVWGQSSKSLRDGPRTPCGPGPYVVTGLSPRPFGTGTCVGVDDGRGIYFDLSSYRHAETGGQQTRRKNSLRIPQLRLWQIGCLEFTNDTGAKCLFETGGEGISPSSRVGTPGTWNHFYLHDRLLHKNSLLDNVEDFFLNTLCVDYSQDHVCDTLGRSYPKL